MARQAHPADRSHRPQPRRPRLLAVLLLACAPALQAVEAPNAPVARTAETAAGRYPVKAVAAMSEVIVGAETYHTTQHRPRERSGVTFTQTEEAIAHAVMYTANHMNVRAIVALTESGSTPLWMSRLRSDIPIYAFTRHERTRRRVTLYRGVRPVAFDVTPGDATPLHDRVFAMLLELQLVDDGDLVILTKGELTGVQGGTNSMQIVQVRQP